MPDCFGADAPHDIASNLDRPSAWPRSALAGPTHVQRLV